MLGSRPYVLAVSFITIHSSFQGSKESSTKPMSENEIKSNRRTLKFSLISSIFLFLSLISWSFSGPITSGYDSTYHLSNIWCAAGEQSGICENISSVSGATEADIPSVLSGEAEAGDYTRVVLASPTKKSPFYSILNVFVTENTTQSVLILRIFNSLISAFIFFALLYFGTNRSRIASVSAWTFTIVPIIIATLWQPNPRSWGYLSVMSSWVLLHIALSKHDFKRTKQICLWFTFTFSLLLAFTSRIDAALFSIFACVVVFAAHLFRKGHLKLKQFVVASSIFMTFFLLVRFLSSSIQWYTQFSFNAVFSGNQSLFVLIHLPENIADGLGLGLRYPDLGPNSIGIIGIGLYAVAITSWLLAANKLQMFVTTSAFGFMLLAMFQIAFNWPEANEASGVYVVALLTVCLGFAATYSEKISYFPSTAIQRVVVILLVSISHALTLYSKFEWSVSESSSNDSYNKLSLNDGWWWNSAIGPNAVYLIGAFAFPAWLYTSWAVVNKEPVELNS